MQCRSVVGTFQTHDICPCSTSQHRCLHLDEKSWWLVRAILFSTLTGQDRRCLRGHLRQSVLCICFQLFAAHLYTEQPSPSMKVYLILSCKIVRLLFDFISLEGAPFLLNPYKTRSSKYLVRQNQEAFQSQLREGLRWSSSIFSQEKAYLLKFYYL